MTKVFELLKTGNFQAKVIKDNLGFKVGMDVDLMLTGRDTVVVVECGNEENADELNLDTHADYDQYFEIY